MFGKALQKSKNKIRDKLGLYALRALYGKSIDIGCNFYGPEQSCRTVVDDSSSVGIVFQGPIVNERKLTEGLSHYRRLFPNSCIVLSTWTGSIHSNFRKQLEVLGIHSVESSSPEIDGIMNVNRQILSTERGVNALLMHAAPELIVKARTDFFPWRPDKAVSALRVYERLLGGESRVWAVDINTRLDLPFSVADMFQIGRTDVMKIYWTEVPLYSKNISVQQFFELTNYQQDMAAILKLQPAEIYLATRYLNARGCRYDYTSLTDYHAALGHWFGILDAQHIEFGFGKYAFMTPGYEPVSDRHKKYVKAQDWMAMIQLKH